MKKLLVLISAFLFFATLMFGQNDHIRQSELGISFNLYDIKTAQRIRTTSLSSVLSNKQVAKLRDMAPGLGIHYFKGIKKHIDFAGNLAATFISYPIRNRPNLSSDRLLLTFDATAQFKLTSEEYWVQPFVLGGVGAHTYGPYWGAYIPLGVGMNLDLYSETKLFINSQYRVPVTTGSSNYHFYHAIGISGVIGKKKEPKVIPPPPLPSPPKDSDGDGITDDNDKCPTVPGVVKYDGCPVPDTDKDGINDDDDKCPTVAGLAKYQGCPVPDTDKDGINDEDDKCPTVAGVARYQGCPVPDTDKDGINDEEDKCPTVPGIAALQGCPEVSDEVKKTLSYAEQNVYFNTASTKLLNKSFEPLNEVVKILNANSSLKLKINGHTDNVGTEDFNKNLSDGRAASVKAYLAGKGIDAARLESEGFGESTPVADNNTAAGRQKNRRVEMKVYY